MSSYQQPYQPQNYGAPQQPAGGQDQKTQHFPGFDDLSIIHGIGKNGQAFLSISLTARPRFDRTGPMLTATQTGKQNLKMSFSLQGWNAYLAEHLPGIIFTRQDRCTLYATAWDQVATRMYNFFVKHPPVVVPFKNGSGEYSVESAYAVSVEGTLSLNQFNGNDGQPRANAQMSITKFSVHNISGAYAPQGSTPFVMQPMDNGYGAQPAAPQYQQAAPQYQPAAPQYQQAPAAPQYQQPVAPQQAPAAPQYQRPAAPQQAPAAPQYQQPVAPQQAPAAPQYQQPTAPQRAPAAQQPQQAPMTPPGYNAAPQQPSMPAPGADGYYEIDDTEDLPF